MLKKMFLGMALLGCAALPAYDLPGFREVNGIQVHILPEQVGAEVEFTFEKQDINGYTGSDAVVFTTFSPSNKAVWEEAVPDDGSEIGNWKAGPRQPVTCKFKAEEAGIYCMKVNTPSSVDLMLHFDHSTVKNASWALNGTRFRSADGTVKMDAYFLLAPNKLGEKRVQTFQVTTTPRSHVKAMTMLAGSEVLIPTADLERQPKTEALRHRQYPINRLAGEDIYELRATDFCDVAPYQFPQYGEFLLFAEKKFAEKFRAELRKIESDNYLALRAPIKYDDMAFARGVTYQLEFSAQDKAAKFDFEVTLFGQKFHFTSDSPKALLTVPNDNAYSGVDLSAAPAGKLLITRVTATPCAILPEGGKVMTGSEELSWTAQKDAKEYSVKLTNLADGKVVTVAAGGNRLALAAAGALTPGVWQWEVSAKGGKAGVPAFFIVPQKADTAILYFHSFAPARDSVAGAGAAQIAVKIDGKKSSDLDLAQSQLVLNGKNYPLEALAADTVGLSKVPALQDGYNTVTVTAVDKSGNVSRTGWGFFGTKAETPKLSHDERGNIFFNGMPFFPVIYYGYNVNQPVERLGFNTMLLNTLTNEPGLNVYLKRNLKALDSGSVYHGYYSKGSTPEADVQKFAASPAARHSARLGAWMDEMDVHRPLAAIKDFLALYGGSENGWRGICSCNRSLYPAMANCGDYLMIDCYADGKGLFLPDAFTVQGRAAAGQKPLMLLVSGFSRSDPALTGFIPTPKEVEYAAFSALRNHVNALGLYQCGSYRMERYPEAWAAATRIYKKISALSFALYGKEASSQIAAEAKNGSVSFRALELDGHMYVIAQNASFTPVAATFQIKTPAESTVKVLFENRVIAAKGSAFIDGFAAADTHVYVIDLPAKKK